MPYKIIKADIIEWLKEYQGEPFHAMLFDPPYHLTSITERFGKENSKEAKEGVYRRSAAGFMNQRWDGGDLIFQSSTWQLLSTVLHPGAFVMAYCSSRGWHRQAVAMEDGGMIFHPSIFMYGMAFGSGFPKAARIDTQIDAMAGEEREVIDTDSNFGISKLEQGKTTFGDYEGQWNITKPATPLAESWQGHRYGLQLIKPSLEPILVGQKPYQGKSVENIVETGAGAINVEGGRISADWSNDPTRRGWQGGNATNSNSVFGNAGQHRISQPNDSGRWPASLILHHLPECKRVGTKRVRGESGWSKTGSKSGVNIAMSSPNYERESKQDNHTDSDGYETVTEWQCHEKCPIRIIGEQSGEKGQNAKNSYHYTRNRKGHKLAETIGSAESPDNYGDQGTAARYFKQPDWSYEIYEQLNNADLLQYITKPSTTEREAGLEKLPFGAFNSDDMSKDIDDSDKTPQQRKNTHPTVKSIALNKYLATLLLPPSEYAPRRILVPFCGSGSEVIGCLLAGWDEVIGIELEQEYYDIATERVAWWYKVMENCNYDVDNIIKHWQEEQKSKESGQMRLL